MFAILTGNKAFITNTIVSIISIDALAVFADAFLLAFVRFAAFVRLFVSFLSGWAIATERADCVDALAAFAKSRNSLAFVDIYNNPISIERLSSVGASK